MKKIVVPVRNYGTGSIIAKYPIKMVKTNLLSLESCRLAVRGARFIFHLAYDSSPNSTDNVTILGTRNILKAALLEGVESVLVFSTATVWMGSKASLIDETTALSPALGKYGRDKAVMQKESLAFAKKNPSIRVSIIAPGSVYGPGSNLFCEMPFKLAKNGIFKWFENGKGTVNYIYVDNLIDMALLAASKKDISGHVFIGVDGESNWKNFLLPLVNEFGDNVKSISKGTIFKIAKDDLLKFLGKHPGLKLFM
jgi:nucleoside-diphosphate-sugar epimerase